MIIKYDRLIIGTEKGGQLAYADKGRFPIKCIKRNKREREEKEKERERERDIDAHGCMSERQIGDGRGKKGTREEDKEGF